MLRLKPVTLREANVFIAVHHRHCSVTRGHKFSIGAVDDSGALVGVVVVGRPVARRLDDGWTAEVTRLATDGTRNACSLLYGAAARAAKAMGYLSLVTYTLASECGASLRAAGWISEGEAGGGGWGRTGRPRPASADTGPKVRWRKRFHAGA